ncbi:MAG: serine hydrolase domain-containing protein [Actinomycetes bacterium]
MHETFAVVVVRRGRIIAERYANRLPSFTDEGRPVGADVPLLSWSMAKSMLHATVGLLIGDGRLALTDRPFAPEWSEDDDPRGAITLEHLLEMRDGLAWREVYSVDAPSDVVTMLFGEGRTDVAHFAADRPATAPPGTRFCYSSGSSNIISRHLASILGPGDASGRYLEDHLFAPIGMTSARPTFDAAGTWIASTFVHATARDFARFGLLYLRDGVWDGTRILPEGWVDTARTARATDPDDGRRYALHWWVAEDRFGSFWANGYEGQSILVCPALDVVLVRIGRTDPAGCDLLPGWRTRVLEALAAD